MVRGTTPSLSFSLPVKPSTISTLYVTLTQAGVTVIEKTIDDVSFGDDNFTVTLTQAETLLLNDKKPVAIQVRFKTADGNAYASSPPIVSEVGVILKNGQI